MISLARKIKKEREQNEENNNERVGVQTNGNRHKRATIRDKLLVKEIQEMEQNLPLTCRVKYGNPDEIHKMELTVEPDESFWAGGRFRFTLDVPEDYNLLPPTVKCLTRIYHPNINEQGDICLSLLRERSIDGLGWAPTRTMKDVIWGLNSLFTDLLNFDDPLNDEAAEHYRRDKDGFRVKVKDYVQKYAKL